MKNIFLIIAFSLSSFIGVSQNDSTKVVTYIEFIHQVKSNHPIAKQAEIQVLKGEAYLQKSKGLFDPKIYYDIQQKYYNDKQYYSIMDGGVKIPTWFGVELKGGLSQNTGYYLNSEHNVPDGGLLYAGISVPVGKRLFIDERRSELKKAQAYVKITEAERKNLLNKLLYSSGKSYWEWFQAYNTVLVYEEAFELANKRFKAVKQSAALGDRPQIDTLESGIQVQNRKLKLQEAQIDLFNAKSMLEVYLWAEGVVPLELSDIAVPFDRNTIGVLPVDETLVQQFDSISTSHPKLQQFDYKLQQLDIDIRWMAEQLKPQLDLNYQPITAAIPDGSSTYSINDYKWGLSFSMPILLRKERGQLKIANLKIKEVKLDSKLMLANLSYEVSTALNEWNITVNQVNLYTQTVSDYHNLLLGEQQLFNIGESSLFMVNSREMGYINAELKLIEILTKNHKASLKTKYALGILWQE